MTGPAFTRLPHHGNNRPTSAMYRAPRASLDMPRRSPSRLDEDSRDDRSTVTSPRHSLISPRATPLPAATSGAGEGTGALSARTRAWSRLEANQLDPSFSDDDERSESRPKSATTKRVTFEPPRASTGTAAPQGSAQAAAKFARTCRNYDARRTELLSPGKLWVTPKLPTTPRNVVMEMQRVSARAVLEAAASRTQVAKVDDPRQRVALMSSEGSHATHDDGGELVEMVPRHVRCLLDMYCPVPSAEQEPHSVTDALLALTNSKGKDHEVRLQEEAKRVRTGEEAIAYFAKHGDESDVKVIYCRRCVTDPRSFRPYDLVTVHEKDRGDEFFMISAKGIVHVCPGQLAEHTSLGDWMHQAMTFTVLQSMSCFKNFLAGRALGRWRQATCHQAYVAVRARLARHLFLAKPQFVKAQAGIHSALGALGDTKVLHLDPGSRLLFELQAFAAQQKELQAASSFDARVDRARTLVDEVITAVLCSVERAEVAEERGRALRGRVVLPLVTEREQREERTYRLRLCKFNKSLLGDFIRLVDVMVQSRLVAIILVQASQVLDRISSAPKIFSASVTFAEDGTTIAFSPNLANFEEVFNDLLTRSVSIVDGVTALSLAQKYFAHSKADASPSNTGAVLNRDVTFARITQGITDTIHAVFGKAQNFVESYFGPYRKINTFCRMWDAAAFEAQGSPHSEIIQQLSDVSDHEHELEKLKSVHTCGFLLIEARSLRSTLAPIVESSLATMKSRLQTCARDSCRQAIERVDLALKEMSQRPLKLDGFIEYVRAFRETQAQLERFENARATVEEIYATLRQYSIRIEMTEDIARDTLAQRTHLLLNGTLVEASAFVQEHLQSNADDVAQRFDAVEMEAEALEYELSSGESADPGNLTDFQEEVGAVPMLAGSSEVRVLQVLEDAEKRIKEMETSAGYLNGSLKLLCGPERKHVAIAAARECCRRRLRMWELALQWQQTVCQWICCTISAFDVRAWRSKVEAYRRAAEQLLVDLPNDPVAEALRSRAVAWGSRLPALELLTGPAMQAKHWSQVLHPIGVRPATGDSAIGALLEAGFFSPEGQRTLRGVAAAAAAEFGATSAAACVTGIWMSHELAIVRRGDYWYLGGQAPTMDMLRSDVAMLRSIHADSRLAEEVLQRSRELAATLENSIETLSLWTQTQDAFFALEPLVPPMVPDAENSSATEIFDPVRQSWRQLMHRARTTYRYLMPATSQPSLLSTLRRLGAEMVRAREAVEAAGAMDEGDYM